jgi:hypothetical protein
MGLRMQKARAFALLRPVQSEPRRRVVYRTMVSAGTLASAAAIPPIPKYDGRSPVTGVILG